MSRVFLDFSSFHLVELLNFSLLPAAHYNNSRFINLTMIQNQTRVDKIFLFHGRFLEDISKADRNLTLLQNKGEKSISNHVVLEDWLKVGPHFEILIIPLHTLITWFNYQRIQLTCSKHLVVDRANFQGFEVPTFHLIKTHLVSKVVLNYVCTVWNHFWNSVG